MSELLNLFHNQGRGRPVGNRAGWWLTGGIPAANCIAAYQPKGAASYAISKVNLANPGTYDAYEAGSPPSWASATGWTFNGSVYLRGGINVSNNVWSYLVFEESYSSDAYDIVLGGQTNPNNVAICPRLSGNLSYMNGTSLLTGGASITGKHVLAMTNYGYLDGTSVTTSLGTWSGASIRIDYGSIGGANSFEGNIYAIAIYNITLSPTQIALLTTVMRALQ